MRHGPTLGLLAAALTLAGCTAAGDDLPTCHGDKCDALGDVRSQLDGLDDPIAVWLRKSDMSSDGLIATDYLTVVQRVGEVMGCGLDTMKTFVLSDDLVAGQPFPRLISTVCSDDDGRAPDFFVAASFQDPGNPADVDPQTLELFAWDQGRREYVFYATQREPGRKEVQVEVSPERCRGCHLNSRSLDDANMPMLPIMNELTTPWPHWNAEPDFPSETFVVRDETRAAPNFSALTGTGRLGAAPRFEQIIRAGQANRPINARLRTRRDPANVDQAMALLRPLYCAEQVNYVTEDHGSGVLPAAAIIEGGTRDLYLAIRPTDWPWPWLNDDQLRFAAPSATPLAMIPVRGNADVELEKRLVAFRALAPEDVLRIHALDWSEPAFSAMRCGLWKDTTARLRAHPLAFATAKTNADLLPLLYREIMQAGGASLIRSDGRFLALRSGSPTDLAKAAAGAASTTSCASGTCAVDPVGFGDLLQAQLVANQPSRALLAKARSERQCVVTADFPNRPAFPSPKCPHGAQPTAPKTTGNLESAAGRDDLTSFFQGANQEAQAIPDDDAAGIASTIHAHGAQSTSFVSVRLDVVHPWRGDLTVTITTPDGARVPVVALAPDDSSDDLDQEFVIADLPLEVDGSGDWTLRLADGAPGEEGILLGWSLGLNASAPSLEGPGARIAP